MRTAAGSLTRLRIAFHSRTLAIGALITAAVLFAITVGPALSPWQADQMDFLAVLSPPTWAHPLGTDSFGRDLLTRVMLGGRISLFASLSGVVLGSTIGVTLGMLTAWSGGWLDSVVMAAVDVLFAFPSFVLALFIMVVLGFGLHDVIVAIALSYLPIFARLARNLTRVMIDEPFVQAARVSGMGAGRILLVEILPNIASALLVQVTIGVAFGIVMEAGLSFLGLGVQPPTASLGAILADGREYFQRGPWVLTLTGLVTTVALLGLNLLGDGLRDLSDPRLRRSFER